MYTLGQVCSVSILCIVHILRHSEGRKQGLLIHIELMNQIRSYLQLLGGCRTTQIYNIENIIFI